MRRADTMWKALGKAAVLHAGRFDSPLVLLTTDAPARGSSAHAAIDSLTGLRKPVLDVARLLDRSDADRLKQYALRGCPKR